MKRRSAWCCVALSLFLITPAFAKEGVEVEIEREAGVFHVRIRMPVAADADTAWQVITDYDHLAEFVPGLTSSKVIGTEPLQIEQKGNTGLFVFTRDFDVVLELKTTPPTQLDFQAVRGAKRIAGHWGIQKQNRAEDAGMVSNDGIRIEYVAEIEPDFWVPPLIGTAVMRRNIRKSVEGVATEISRRYAEKAMQQHPSQ